MTEKGIESALWTVAEETKSAEESVDNKEIIVEEKKVPAEETKAIEPEKSWMKVERPREEIQENASEKSTKVVEEPKEDVKEDEPSEEVAPEEPKTKEEEVKEEPISKEEEKEIKEEVEKWSEEKKENLVEEIQDAVEKWEEIEPLLNSLFSDLNEKTYESIKYQSESMFYQKENERLREELNKMKYDDSKIIVGEDDRPYFVLTQQIKENPENPELLRRYIQRTYERIEKFAPGVDHSDKIHQIYNKWEAAVTWLSGTDSFGGSDLTKKKEDKAQPTWLKVPRPKF